MEQLYNLGNIYEVLSQMVNISHNMHHLYCGKKCKEREIFSTFRRFPGHLALE